MLQKLEAPRERERESKRLRRFVTTFFLTLSLLLQNFLFLVSPVYAATSPWTQTDWSGGSGQTSWSDNTKFDTSSTVTTSTAGQVTLQATSSWYNTSWKYRRAITIDNTGNSNTLTNYQMNVALTSLNFSFSKAQSAGQDIRFTDNDGTTLLNYWFESYDSSGQTATIWVKVPSISASSSKTIYLYYGNGTATDNQNGTNTFDFFDSFDGGVYYWTRQGTVLSASTAPEDSNVYEPTVIYEGSPQILSGQTNVFKMWYSGGWNSPNLNYAESTDGISWTKYGSNPIISAHNRSYVFKSGSTYYLYAANTANTQIDLYTSSDGVNFTLDTSSVIAIGSTGQWDASHIANLEIWIEGSNSWKMLYEASGDVWKIGLATSTDGRTWTKSASNPVISETGSRGGPWINKIGSTYYLWVHGSPTGGLPTDLYRYTSTDLVTWTNSPVGIVLARRTSDEGVGTSVGQVADPTYLEYNGSVYVWYAASSDGTSQSAGQHIKLAIASGKTFNDLIASNEDYGTSSSLSSAWTTRGSMSIIDNELDMPANTSTDSTPTFESTYTGTNYIYEFSAKRTGGTTTRLQPVYAYIDDSNFARYWTADASTTYFQTKVSGVWSDVTNVGTNNAVDGAYHKWKIVRTASGVTLYIDGSQIGTTQSLPATFNTATKIGLSGYNATGKWDNVRIRQYTSPEPSTSSGSEVPQVQTSGTLTSSIFDTEFSAGAAWGTLTYTATTPSNTSVSVKARTSNSSAMSGATAFSSCTAVTSGSDISSNSCVTDSHRYIQYQIIAANTDSVSTPTFQDVSIAFSAYDTTPPSISLTALTPDPNSDNTPSLSGTATESIGTVSNVQFQMDGTSGSWSSCSATDGSFNSASEAFSCTPSALTDGSHTMYVRATDSNSNTTSNANASTDTFTIDATAPVSFDLDSPGDNSYTNSERPTFKWKATTDANAGLSKYVLEIDNPSIGPGQPSGDFTIDSIPTSRTTDYETNKYIVHYENFSDSDSTNNYISVYTKSHNDWGSSENDGKLREGKVNWKVKAVDNAGNERASSRTLFVDRTSPTVAFTQINSTPYTTNNFSTTDKTPTIFGKITDSLSGGDSSQTQDENGPKVASGPKEVNIKVEKKEGLTYKLVTLYKINMDNPYYTCETGKIIDNSKQKCDKYLPFEYTSKENLGLGTYKITLYGKDKADNTSSETSFTLNITTLAQITTPEEKEIIEKEIKELPKEVQEKVKEELEITKPTEAPNQNILEQTGESILQISKNVISTTGNIISACFTGIGTGIKTVFNGIGSGFAFVGNFIGNSYGTLANHAPGVAKNILVAIGTNVNNIINGTRNRIANLAFAIGEKTDDVSHSVGTAIIKIGYIFVPEPTKISNVNAVALSPTAVKITWTTNHPANGKVNWGYEDGIYKFEDQTDKRTSQHEFVLTNLKSDTEYHYEVMSQNRNYVYDANRKFKTPAE
ncbi:MAG: DUF2341 domain-containing protein [Patescibacteria group bacterium]